MAARRSRVAAIVWGCVLAVGAAQANDRLTADVAPAEGEIVVVPAWADREPCTAGEPERFKCAASMTTDELDRLRRLAEDALLQVLASDPGWVLQDAELTVDRFAKPEAVEPRLAPRN